MHMREQSLNNLANRFAQRLRDQRSGEKSALPEPLPSPDANTSQSQIESTWNRFVQLAAVSGRFNPADLFPSDAGDDLRLQVLNRASPIHNVEVVGSKVQWQLQSDFRKAELKRLQDSSALSGLIDGPLPYTDSFGQAIRKVIQQGDGFSFAELSTDAILAVKAAIEVLSDTGIKLPDINQVQLKLATDEFARNHIATVENFIGRENELAALRSFLVKPPDPTFWQPWTSFVITGLGGAGKSALLAQFMREVYLTKSATLAILDFDRTFINPTDTVWLRQELARQVGMQFPEHQTVLKAERQQARQIRPTFYGHDFSSIERSYDTVINRIKDVLLSRDQAKPLVLVLDTLEELSESSAQESLLKWMDALGDNLSPIRLKVIFSGRLFDDSLRPFVARRPIGTIHLDALPPEVARQMLEKEGVPLYLADALVNHPPLPLRPLELRLMATEAKRPGMTREQIEDELLAGDHCTTIATGLVYRRVLTRIQDPVLRKIASPGLVLRFVTPEILQQVLSPALDLPPMTERQAQEMLAKLQKTSWLVTMKANGQLWHRSDLRRSMLKPMIAQEPDTADKIHRLAIDFFTKSSSNEDETEANYHRLMLASRGPDEVNLELQSIAESFSGIGADIDDLPPGSRALLKFAANHELTQQDVMVLPSRYFQRAYAGAGQRLAHAREYRQAWLLIERSWREFGNSLSQLSTWEADTLFATCRWPMLSSELGKLSYRSSAGSIKPWFYRVALKVASLPQDTSLLLESIDFLDTVRKEVDEGSSEIARSVTDWNYLAMGILLLDSHLYRSISQQLPFVTGFLRYFENIDNKPKSALLNHRLYLMSSLSTQKVGTTPRLAPSLLRLRKRTLERLTHAIPNSRIRESLSITSKELKARPTSKTLLSRIDTLYRYEEDWKSIDVIELARITGMGSDLLRGPDPEFRDPLRYSILEEYTTSQARSRLAGIFQSLLDFPLADLEPGRFVGELDNDAEHSLIPFVELIDRAWQIGPLLKALCMDRPDSVSLQHIRSLYTEWDGTVNSVLRL